MPRRATVDRERDYQAPGAFLLQAAWKFVACEVFIIDVHPSESAVFHFRPSCPVGNRAALVSIAHPGHMMWINQHLRQRRRIGLIVGVFL